MVIVVATDQHLGYVNSNSKEFSDFLDYISKRTDVTDFVLLGDFIDMWRRDVSGLFLQHSDILKKVLALKTAMNVYCIAGNHDYHLLSLSSENNPFRENYPLEFLPRLDLPKDNPKYLFRHGWEFDSAQHPAIMETLCYNFSDEAGKIRSEIWDVLTNTIEKDTLGEIKNIINRFEGKDKYIESILQPPNKRLESTPDLVEHIAYTLSKKADQILVFGHTHRPFVNTDKNVVNAGSWVSDAKITNTFVELDGTRIGLMQYNEGKIIEITEREKCS
jgi:UDP-2,3-diacylglucosamine pyrophosphatase LpxH